MPASAWIMLIIGVSIIYGGLTLSIIKAVKSSKESSKKS